jgi:alpha-glucosidase
MAFALIRAPWDAQGWKRAIDIDRRALRGARRSPSWTLSNHDVVRHVTRFGGGLRGRARARAAVLMLLGLPGQVFLYQGDELGLEEVIVPENKRQDPFFIHSHGKEVGRDGCRVPMPWQRGRPHAGFSVKAPWLPMPAGWDRLAVDAQLASAGSMLGFYRRVLAVRRELDGVLDTDMRWSPAPAGVLAYHRGRLKVAVNFLARPVEIPVRGRMLIGSQPRVLLQTGKLILPANSGAWIDTAGGR